MLSDILDKEDGDATMPQWAMTALGAHLWIDAPASHPYKMVLARLQEPISTTFLRVLFGWIN